MAQCASDTELLATVVAYTMLLRDHCDCLQVPAEEAHVNMEALRR
jgi:hypothetical protein